MSEFRELMDALVQFRDSNDWAQFHDTKNLVVAKVGAKKYDEL